VKTHTESIGGEINIDFTVGKGADGEREIQGQVEASALFGTPFKGHISLNLADFTDSKGRTIGDLLAEHGEDVFKIIDQEEP
jgi:hypothetical protein